MAKTMTLRLRAVKLQKNHSILFSSILITIRVSQRIFFQQFAETHLQGKLNLTRIPRFFLHVERSFVLTIDRKRDNTLDLKLWLRA